MKKLTYEDVLLIAQQKALLLIENQQSVSFKNCIGCEYKAQEIGHVSCRKNNWSQKNCPLDHIAVHMKRTNCVCLIWGSMEEMTHVVDTIDEILVERRRK